MKDGIPKGAGNSRYLKSAISSATTWEQFRDMLRNGTLPIDLGGINAAGWQVVGDALNKANLLPDSVASNLGLTGNPQVKDALGVLTPVAELITLYSRTISISNASYNSNTTASTTLVSNLMDCKAYDYILVNVAGALRAKTTYNYDTGSYLAVGEWASYNNFGRVDAGGNSTEITNQISGTITLEKYVDQYGGIKFMALNAWGPPYGNAPVVDPTRICIGGGTSSARTCYVSGSLRVTVKGAKKTGVFA